MCPTPPHRSVSAITAVTRLAGVWLIVVVALVLSPGAAVAGAVVDLSFEGNLLDSSGNGNNAAVLTGSPGYSNNVPVSVVPGTGQPNTQSLSLGTGASIAVSSAFPFDYLPDATLEFWVNPNSVSSEQDLFWTTTGGGDTNRFNIGIGAGGGVFMDYREPGGTDHSLVSGGSVSANQWTFVAIVKSGNTYTLYVNDVDVSQVTDSSPTLPTSTGWTINGRADEDGTSCCQFSGLLDEVAIADQALAPSQFEDVPEPGTLLLTISALGGLFAARRRTGGANRKTS